MANLALRANKRRMGMKVSPTLGKTHGITDTGQIVGGPEGSYWRVGWRVTKGGNYVATFVSFFEPGKLGRPQKVSPRKLKSR